MPGTAVGSGAVKQATVLPSAAYVPGAGTDSELSRGICMFGGVGAKRRGKGRGEGKGCQIGMRLAVSNEVGITREGDFLKCISSY